MFMRNKRHVGGAITIRLTQNFDLAEQLGAGSFTGLTIDGKGYRMTGVLSFNSGSVAQFDAPLLAGEKKNLERIFREVADRVHSYLRDDLDRRSQSRRLTR
jgi:hypothetical protein